MALSSSKAYVLQGSVRTVWGIALPIMLHNLVHSLLTWIDTIYAGHVNEATLAAVGVASIYYTLVYLVLYGITLSFQIRFSMLLGSERLHRLPLLLSHVLILIVIAWLFVWFLGTAAIPWVFPAKSNNYNLLIHHYLHIRFWGLPFTILSLFFHAYFTALAKTMLFIPVGFSTAALNALLNYWWVYRQVGGLSAEEGLAWASLCAEAFASLTFFLIYWIKRKHWVLLSFYPFHLDKRYLKRLLWFATPVILQYLVAIGGWFLFFLLIDTYGTTAVASANLNRNLYLLVSIPTWGLASAMHSVAANLKGQGKIAVIKKLLYQVSFSSFFTMVVITLSVYVFFEPLLSFYTHSAQAIQWSLFSFPMMAIGWLIYAFSTLFFNTLLALGKTSQTFLCEFTAVMAYVLGAYLLIKVFHVAYPWAWSVDPLYWLILWIISFYFLRRYGV